MNVRIHTAAGVLVLAGSGVLLGGTAASAAPPACDAYSTTCPTLPPTVPIDDNGGGADTDTTAGGGGATVDSPSTLPFTGGELVLLTTLGLGALAGGTALVVAGRRKSAPSA